MKYADTVSIILKDGGENHKKKKGNKRIKGCLSGTVNTLVPHIAVQVIKIIDIVKNEF